MIGEYDLPDQQEAVVYLAGLWSDGKVVTIPDAAHLPCLGQPARFNRSLREFLDTL